MDSYGLEKDLHEAQRMAEALSAYLLQQNIYYHIGNDVPKMTIGSLLLRTRRLHFFKDALFVEQQEVLDEIDRLHSQAIQDWRVHYITKLSAELKTRLTMLERYLEDCEGSPEECPEFFPPEALRRTLIQELLDKLHQLNVDDLQGVDSHVREFDKRLETLLQKADFIWSEKLEEVYPKDEYWWLYRQPVEKQTELFALFEPRETQD